MTADASPGADGAASDSQLLWLNGPFGVGKSTVARLLRGRLGATVFEPSGLGHVLTKLVPDGRISDLDDDLPLWRSTVVHVARELSRHGNRLIILPAAVYRYDHVVEMITGLRISGTDVVHVVLLAEKAELALRIHRGPFGDATKRLYLGHLTAALSALSDPSGLGRGPVIDTTYRSPVDVAAGIVGMLPRWRWGPAPHRHDQRDSPRSPASA
jgi:hypothetical protein